MTRRFNPYQTLRTEPNLREEFHRTMEGFFPEISKRQKFVLRKMRSNSSGSLIKCACVDPLTREPDKDKFCPYCFGEGYLWDESIHDGYYKILGSSSGISSGEILVSPGNVSLLRVSFYFEYDFPLNRFPGSCSLPHEEHPDKIVEPMTDLEGKLVEPFKRQRIYRIGHAIDFRSDSGKLEYWRLDCYEEQVKFLNGPRG